MRLTDPQGVVHEAKILGRDNGRERLVCARTTCGCYPTTSWQCAVDPDAAITCSSCSSRLNVESQYDLFTAGTNTLQIGLSMQCRGRNGYFAAKRMVISEYTSLPEEEKYLKIEVYSGTPAAVAPVILRITQKEAAAVVKALLSSV